MRKNYNKYKLSSKQELEKKIKKLEIKEIMSQPQLKIDLTVILNN